MLDFTSALYLGMQHPSRSLRAWQRLTTGAPAALVEPGEAREIGQALADLQGCEAATLGTSTLHLALDLFGLLAEKPITIFMDAGAYPISRWGVQRAAMRGAAVGSFPHHDPAALQRAMAGGRQSSPRLQPTSRRFRGKAPTQPHLSPRARMSVIVTDGFCPTCGRVAPLREYLALARSYGGVLVVDDTQACGILGHSPNAQMPYGRGGGGSLCWSGIAGGHALVFSSLAKGFGVPMAMLAGSRVAIERFEDKSLTRVHCSPPSIAALRAAEHALSRNRLDGDARRGWLLESVRRFRRGVQAAGMAPGPGLFPVQAIGPAPDLPPATLHRRLLERGLRAVLIGGEDGQPRLSFLLTARHTPEEIEAAVAALSAVSSTQPLPFKPINEETHHEKSVCH